MHFNIRQVAGAGLAIGAGLVMVSRQIAESHQAVPSDERIERAKTRLHEIELDSVVTLIDIIHMLESEEAVVGYFGFTYDSHRITQTPLTEGETQDDRVIKILGLPHPQWGTRRGTRTVMGELVKLSEDADLVKLTSEEKVLFNQMINAGATFLAQGSSDGAS